MDDAPKESVAPVRFTSLLTENSYRWLAELTEAPDAAHPDAYIGASKPVRVPDPTKLREDAPKVFELAATLAVGEAGSEAISYSRTVTAWALKATTRAHAAVSNDFFIIKILQVYSPDMIIIGYWCHWVNPFFRYFLSMRLNGRRLEMRQLWISVRNHPEILADWYNSGQNWRFFQSGHGKKIFDWFLNERKKMSI